jgi:hypothetical protein
MAPKHDPIKEKIQKASEAMDQDPRYRGTQAALDFMVLYHCLMAQRRGQPTSNTRGGHNKKLSAPQDYALKDYIFMLHGANTNANMTEI